MRRAERETILRFDDDERRLHLFTASPTVARRWTMQGIPLQVTGRDRQGRPQGWGAVVPLACLRPLRALNPDGTVRRRPGHGGYFRHGAPINWSRPRSDCPLDSLRALGARGPVQNRANERGLAPERLSASGRSNASSDSGQTIRDDRSSGRSMNVQRRYSGPVMRS